MKNKQCYLNVTKKRKFKVFLRIFEKFWISLVSGSYHSESLGILGVTPALNKTTSLERNSKL